MTESPSEEELEQAIGKLCSGKAGGVWNFSRNGEGCML